MIEKKVSRCGETYYWPAQAWIHAFCALESPCVSIEHKDTQWLKDKRQAAYRSSRDYGIAEGKNDPFSASIIYRLLQNVDADVDVLDVDATGAMEGASTFGVSTASTASTLEASAPSTLSTAERAKRMKADRMKRWRAAKVKG